MSDWIVTVVYAGLPEREYAFARTLPAAATHTCLATDGYARTAVTVAVTAISMTGALAAALNLLGATTLELGAAPVAADVVGRAEHVRQLDGLLGTVERIAS